MNQLLRNIQRAQSPQAIFRLFEQNMLSYEAKHFLQSLIRINSIKQPNLLTSQNLKNYFENQMCKLNFNPDDDLWKFYVEAAKIRRFPKFTAFMARTILAEKKFISINQISKFFWCLAKAEIPPLEEVTLLLKHIEKILSSDDYQPSGNDPFVLEKLSYTQKDLNLLLWSLATMGFESSVIINKIDIQKLDLQSAIIYVYSLSKYKDKKRIYDMLDFLESSRLEDMKDQNIVSLKLLIQTMGAVQAQNKVLAIKAVKQILKRQEKNNLSAKFASQINWALYRMGVDDRSLFNLLVLEVERTIGAMNELDLAQNLAVFAKLSSQYPDHSGFRQFVKNLCDTIANKKQILRNRSLSMIKEVKDEYNLTKLKL